MPYNESAKRATMKYIKANYDRVEIRIPKGRRADIQAIAEMAGESVNVYITQAVFARMGISDWADLDDSTADQAHDTRI